MGKQKKNRKKSKVKILFIFDRLLDRLLELLFREKEGKKGK